MYAYSIYFCSLVALSCDVQQGRFPSQAFQTVRAFIKEMPIVATDETSSLAMRSKAAALFEHATHLASRYTPSQHFIPLF